MNINNASREQLEQAFQVDGERAEYIVRKREELGGFKNWGQFKEVVPSFEDKMVENLESAGFTLSDEGRQQAGSSSNEERRHHSSSHRTASNKSEHSREVSRRTSAQDINEASAAELERAFQIDGERAQYLVKKRRELGGFSSWDQIKQEVPSFEDKMIRHLEEAGFTLGSHNRKAA